MRISDWSSDVCSSDLWAIRLFALTVGSWLYRMEYALWYLAMGDLGTNHFHGWFDAIMMFFFYVPNLLVAEFFIRARDGGTHGKGEIPAALALIAASLFIAVATWFFTVSNWGPGMAKEIGRANVGTPVTNEHIVCRLLLEKNK